MKTLLIAFVWLMPLQVMAETPSKPDPHDVLNEARADARTGRYEAALLKHLWFHHFALEIDRAYYGVRLSFALSDWRELSKVYPPALAMLVQTRDDAAKRVAEHKEDVFDAFNDMLAINEQFGEEGRTVETFVLLDKEAPDVARRVYDLAQPALVKAKKFKLCGKFLQPEKDYASMVELYRLDLKFANEEKEASGANAQLDQLRGKSVYRRIRHTHCLAHP